MTLDGTPIGDALSLVRSRLGRDRMGGKVARGAFTTILVNGAGAGVSFLVQIMLARVLGRPVYGAYLLAIGYFSAALIVAKLELDTLGVRFVGAYAATGQWGLLRGYLRESRTAVVMASLVTAAVGALAVLLLAEPLGAKHEQLAPAMLVACLLLPVVALLLLEGSFLQGFQRYAQAQLPLNLIRPLVFGLGFAAIAVTAPRAVGAAWTVAANLAGAVIALAVTVRWRRQATPGEVHLAEAAHDSKTWARTAYPLFAVSLAQLVISHQSDVIVVGTMLGTDAAAHYGAASQLTMPLVLAASSVTFVAQPIIADLYARNERHRLQSLVRAVTWAAAIVAIPIALMLVLLGPWLLSLWGPSYAEAHPVLVVLTLAQLVIGLVGALAGFLLTMTAHEREAAWIIGLSALLNVVLAVLFTPVWGALGTAVATLTAAAARAATLSIYIRRTMGLRLPAFGPGRGQSQVGAGR